MKLSYWYWFLGVWFVCLVSTVITLGIQNYINNKISMPTQCVNISNNIEDLKCPADHFIKMMEPGDKFGCCPIESMEDRISALESHRKILCDNFHVRTIDGKIVCADEYDGYIDTLISFDEVEATPTPTSTPIIQIGY